MSQFTGLSDETTSQHRAVIHFRAGRDDKVFGNHTVADKNRSFPVAVNRAVIETCTVLDRRIIANKSIPDGPRIDDLYVITDVPYLPVLKSA